eukprot:gene13708-19601_t
MIFTSVVGHLMGLEFGATHKRWHSCSPLDLFDAPVDKFVPDLFDAPVDKFVPDNAPVVRCTFGACHKNWRSCSPLDPFDAPVNKFVPEDKKDVAKNLEQLSRQCQWLVLWLDCDREGENISFEVIHVCCGANPRLTVKRARFSALTAQQLHATLASLHLPNENDSLAVDARQEIDLRVGASFTRFQTLLLQAFAAFNRFQTLLLQTRFNWVAFGVKEKPLISYGPCQFPTLGLIVQRAWEVQSHVAEPFWAIHMVYREDLEAMKYEQDQKASQGLKSGQGAGKMDKKPASCKFDWTRGRLFDEDAASMLYEMCLEEPIATVESVHGQQRTRQAPAPLSTMEMQKRGTQWLRIPGERIMKMAEELYLSGERIMKMAEELYQAGYLSYPRTETDSFSKDMDIMVSPSFDMNIVASPSWDMDIMSLVGQQVNDNRWGAHAQLLHNGGPLWRHPRNGGHDDKAHPPIHPIRYSAGENDWHPHKAQLYEFVVRHFLASCSLDAVGYETVVTARISEDVRASLLMDSEGPVVPTGGSRRWQQHCET